MNSIPSIKFRSRNETVFADLCSQGVDDWVADVLSKRIDSTVSLESCISPKLSKIQDPSKLPDIEKAVRRIKDAILNGEKVTFCVDHDMDGQAAAAVLWTAFVDHFQVPADRLSVVSSHRLAEGYGISDEVVKRLLAIDSSLIISADKGSSDEPRIKTLATAGRDVVVTDHHELPADGAPVSAVACVNPSGSTSEYDPYVCGAGVAWLTMALVRTELLNCGFLSEIPSMALLADYVAVATIADCVSLRPDLSYTNRALVKRGLSLINNLSRPCWQVFSSNLYGSTINSQTVAFQLAPAIASAGRLDWAESGFRFLISENTEKAKFYWAVLQAENEKRKRIEKDLRERAFTSAEELSTSSIVLFIEEGHSGVHGITASRLVERFGRPSAIFTIKGAGIRDGGKTANESSEQRVATGSFRGIPGFNVREALQTVDDRHPGLLISFGGHVGAAGASIPMDSFKLFADAYEEAVCEQLQNRDLNPEIWVDGELQPSLLTLESTDIIESLDPWGRDFPMPVFTGTFRVLSVKAVGDGTHLKITLESRGSRFNAIWFSCTNPEGPLPIVTGQSVSLAYQLGCNYFRGEKSLQLQVCGIGDS